MNFANKGFTYQLQVGHNMCGEDCHDYLEVMHGSKVLRHEICSEAKS